MKLLCKIGVHFINTAIFTEQGKGRMFREYQKCSCGKKKEYLHDGELVHDNDFLGHKGN